MKSSVITKIKKSIKSLYDSGAFHITIGSFFTKFVAFFGSIFVVRLLSKEDYGILQYVENLYGYALVFAGLGLPFSILRYVIIADSNKKRVYLDYAIEHSLIRDFIICSILLLLNFFFPYPNNFGAAKKYIPILAILLPFQNLITNASYSLRSIFKTKEYAYVSFITSLLLIVGRIIGARIRGLSGVVWSRLIINALLSIVLVALVYRIFPSSKGERLTYKEKKDVNLYSLQYMASSGLWAIFMLNDTFFLSFFTNNPTLVAEYKVAYVLPGNLSLISTAIGIYVAPFFTKNENNIDWVKKKFKITIVTTGSIIGLLTIGMIIFAKPLIGFIYGESYLNIVPLMRILLLSAFLNSGFRYVTANLLAAMGKVKENLFVSIMGVILQLVLDVLLIPKYEAVGVAVASCIVFLVMSLALLIIFCKYYIKNKTAA